jgi:hypothetical protein
MLFLESNKLRDGIPWIILSHSPNYTIIKHVKPPNYTTIKHEQTLNLSIRVVIHSNHNSYKFKGFHDLIQNMHN